MKQQFNESAFFLGLDIGSKSCKAALGVVKSWEALDIEILATAEQSSENSVERGSIVNMEKASSIIQKIADRLANAVDIPTDASIYGSFPINNKYVTSRVNRARYPFSKNPREVTKDDLLKAREMASNFPLQNGKDYIHIMTRSYRVDDRLPKRYPEGELGLSIGSEVFLVSAQKQELVKLKQCANRVGLPLNYVCAGAIAAGEGVLTRLEKEQSTVLIDVGAQTTGAIIFENEIPKALSVIPLGSNDVTRDISRITHVPGQLAEQLKIKHTCVDEMYFEQLMESVTTHEEDYDQTFTIQTKDLYKIAYARMYELFKLLYSSLNITDVAHAYPVVLTGGGSRIMGCKQMVERLTGSKVRMAQPWNWGGPVSDYRTPSFSTAVGLCTVAVRHYVSSFSGGGISSATVDISQRVVKHSSIKSLLKNIGGNMKRFFSFGEIEH